MKYFPKKWTILLKSVDFFHNTGKQFCKPEIIFRNTKSIFRKSEIIIQNNEKNFMGSRIWFKEFEIKFEQIWQADWLRLQNLI